MHEPDPDRTDGGCYRRLVYDQTRIARNRKATKFLPNSLKSRVLRQGHFFETFAICVLLESRNSGLVITEPTVLRHDLWGGASYDILEHRREATTQWTCAPGVIMVWWAMSCTCNA